MIRTMQLIITISALGFVAMSTTGCASFGKQLKSWLGGKSSNTAQETSRSSMTKYSDNNNVMSGARRQYKRVTKQSLQEEAQLDDKSGSLWTSEGQGAYLFSQNVLRLVGDPLAITLEGDPHDQLETKVGVIRKLLKRIEDRQAAAAAALREPAADKTDKDKKPGAPGDKKEEGSANQAAAPKPPEQDKSDFNVRTVPTRIVERTVDGNYRVKGSQPFLIGAREYKVIVTGIVRAEDFNDEGVSATKLQDPKFDIVSARRKEEM